jgi:hypothetical protein
MRRFIHAGGVAPRLGAEEFVELAFAQLFERAALGVGGGQGLLAVLDLARGGLVVGSSLLKRTTHGRLVPRGILQRLDAKPAGLRSGASLRSLAFELGAQRSITHGQFALDDQGGRQLSAARIAPRAAQGQ